MPARIRIALFVTASLALLAAAGVTLFGARGGSDDSVAFAGALRPDIPPQDFRLRDQDGKAVSLRAYRGRVVVLTFMYTTCRDTCPLTATQIRGALDDLKAPPPALAVSVDPVNDTPINTVPTDQTIDEDQPITFSNSNGNAISVVDVDAAAGGVQITGTLRDRHLQAIPVEADAAGREAELGLFRRQLPPGGVVEVGGAGVRDDVVGAVGPLARAERVGRRADLDERHLLDAGVGVAPLRIDQRRAFGGLQVDDRGRPFGPKLRRPRDGGHRQTSTFVTK